MAMSDQPLTLAMLDAYLAQKHQRPRFPPAIEAVYNEQMSSYRLEVMEHGILRAIIVYNVFLPIHFLLLPRTAIIALLLHLGVITPAIFGVGWLYRILHRQVLRDAAAAIIPWLMVTQIMFIYSLNRGEIADHYQYLAIMVVIYSNVNQRLSFRVAVFATLVLAATYLAYLLPGHAPFVTKFIGSTLIACAGYLSLMANRRMEQDVRQIFLTRLRDQLRCEGAEKVAKRDTLTGLSNRRELDETVKELWADEKPVVAVAVIMLDIDHFKHFNDSYGHIAGDTCLKRVAAALASELRSTSDLAVRYGGEEFLVLMPDTELSAAIRIAERIRRQIEELAIPHEGVGQLGIVTVSLGVIAGPTAAHEFVELIAGADAALYAAKRAGRNQVWPPFVSRDNPVALLKKTASRGQPSRERS
jgi:diguanylate cyclase (GGDEF)-like protein